MAIKFPGRALKEVFRHLFNKPATRGYPFEKARLQERTRGKIVFEPKKCIGCQMCVKDCPAAAIKITMLPADNVNLSYTSKITKAKTEVKFPKFGQRRFKCDMDLTRCIYCKQCVDSCRPHALSCSHEFELADTVKNNMYITYCPEEEPRLRRS